MNPAYTTGALGGPGHADPAEPRTPWEEPGCPVTPGTLTSQALLNCLVREVSGPEQQTWAGDGALNVRLARSGVLLRATLRRPSAGLGPRLTGAVQRQHGACWQPVGWDDLIRLIAAELTLATGVTNEEFAAQVRDSHAALAAILAVRPEPSRQIPAPGGDAPDEAGDRRIECYLASEQALVAGHRFHPAPKARAGRSRDWLRYAPEAGARFPLRFLGVHDDVLAGDGDTTALERLGGGPDAPPGYRLLPTHPWQLGLLEQRPWFAAARRGGLLLDLGPGTRDVVPTSSVRTVYDHGTDTFAKFSLNMRITNCVRTSAWYEMAGSVVLSGLLRPVFRDLAGLFPGTVLLAEPGYRTVALADREAYEGLAVIVRDGLRRSLAPGVTPLLAAALTEPPRTEPGPARSRTAPGPARSRTAPGPARSRTAPGPARSRHRTRAGSAALRRPGSGLAARLVGRLPAPARAPGAARPVRPRCRAGAAPAERAGRRGYRRLAGAGDRPRPGRRQARRGPA